jgi:hypothetical protein
VNTAKPLIRAAARDGRSRGRDFSWASKLFWLEQTVRFCG